MGRLVSSLIKYGTRQKHQAWNPYDNDLKWSTVSLFKKAGVAFCLDGVTYFQSCYNHEEKELTRVKKYGYLFFPSVEAAIQYQQAIAVMYVKKKGIIWRNDPVPLGPPSLERSPKRVSRGPASALADALRLREKSSRSSWPSYATTPQRLLRIGLD